jgi:hypothetical protein
MSGDVAQPAVKTWFGSLCAWASALATIEQLIESGLPTLRASMMRNYPDKMFAQLGFAVLCGIAAGRWGRRAYYWLVVLPLLWFLMLAVVIILGEG